MGDELAQFDRGEIQITCWMGSVKGWMHNARWEHHGSSLWLQLDVDTGDVRLRADAEDFGVVCTLPSPLDGPVSAKFGATFRSPRDFGVILEIL
jgi:hypothetical protein